MNERVFGGRNLRKKESPWASCRLRVKLFGVIDKVFFLDDGKSDSSTISRPGKALC